ncbi:CoA transferase subunit A [Chloroflexota bacterium]
MTRKEVIINEMEAAEWIRNGMTVAIGGFINALHPMAIIRQIIRKGVKNLTLVGSGSAGLEVDLLIGAGCVRKLISPYVGAEPWVSIGPMYRAMAQTGEIDVWECDEGQYYSGLKAATQMLPFAPWRGGVGTSYPKLNPDFREFRDPIKGEPLLAIPAIEPDVAILHAAYADFYGNVQHIGSPINDIIICRASSKIIVQVEKVISNEEIRRFPERTTIHSANAIVRAPYGSHPYASSGFYIEDTEHIQEYVDSATSFLRTGDRSEFASYLTEYVYHPETHADYLEKIGVKKLLSLYEY